MKNWPWSRLVILGIASIAVLVSADTLAALAGRLQWTGATRWGLPVCVDVLAVYSVVLWIHPQTKQTQRDFARGVAWSMLAVSILGNAAEHIFRALESSADWVHTTLAIVWGSVPSVAAFVAIHMYALGTVTPKRERKAAPTPPASSSAPEAPTPEPVRTESKPPAPTKPEPKPEPLHSVPPPAAKRVPLDDAEIVAWIRDRGGATKQEILDHWRVGGGRALRVLQASEGKAA